MALRAYMQNKSKHQESYMQDKFLHDCCDKTKHISLFHVLFFQSLALHS